MTSLRRLARVCLTVGLGQVIFGAIVRITGSGLGCGNHWPKCNGQWIPPLNRVDLIIEVSHRYLAATLTLAVAALVVAAWLGRRVPGASGRGGVLRPAVLAGVLVVVAALFGAVTVRLDLANKLVIVTHLTIAMGVLAALAAAGERARDAELRAKGVEHQGVSPSTARLATVAAATAVVVIVLGALTANVPGANTACRGFPLCRGSVLPTDPSQYLQFTHRIGAFFLFGLLGWLGVVLTQRRESKMAAMARTALTVLFAQLIIAATMVQFGLPPVWRSLHEAVGTLAWVVLFRFAYVANRWTVTVGERAVVAAVVSPAAEARA